MQIQQIAIDALRPNPRNARTHPKQQIVQLVANIRLLGFLVPILADENGAVLAGHARLLAAKQAGLSVVPVIFVRGLSEAKKRALMLADNKIAENAGWNSEILAIELPELSGLLVDEGLDITLTGFSVPELSRVVTGLEEDLPDQSDAIDPAWLSAAPVSRPGDLWRLAHHRLLCGDACNPDHLARLMAGAQASMAFLAPSLQQPQTRCVEYLTNTLAAAAGVSHEGAIHFVCTDWRHLSELLQAGAAVYAEALDVVVCIRPKADEGALYGSQHDQIAVFRIGKDQPPPEKVQLKRRRRSRGNVWRYPNVSTVSDRDLCSSLPGCKSVTLVADAIKDVTNRRQVVLDPSSGAGTTLLAAELTGRRAYALEAMPRLVDLGIRRWQAFTGQDATHAETGLTFDEHMRDRKFAREDRDGGRHS